MPVAIGSNGPSTPLRDSSRSTLVTPTLSEALQVRLAFEPVSRISPPLGEVTVTVGARRSTDETSPTANSPNAVRQVACVLVGVRVPTVGNDQAKPSQRRGSNWAVFAPASTSAAAKANVALHDVNAGEPLGTSDHQRFA